MADRPTTDIPSSLPVLPLRETVAFPLSVMPLAVNRPVSMDAVNRALSGDRMVFLALQASNVEDPEAADVRLIGTVGVIRQMARAAGGIQIIIEGLQRAKADSISRSEQTMTAQIKPMPEHADGSVEVDAYVRRLQEQVDRALSLSSGLSQELRGVVAEHRRSAAPGLPAGVPARHAAGRKAGRARGRSPDRRSSRPSRRRWPARSRCSR